MKIGCISDDEIGLLVDRFHAKVRVDPAIGPIFERVVLQMRPHLPRKWRDRSTTVDQAKRERVR